MSADTGHQTLREMAQQVEAGALDPMTLVGAVYRYADERDRQPAAQQAPVLDPELTQRIRERLERGGRASAAVLLRDLRDDLSAGQCIAFVKQLQAADRQAVTR